MKDTLQKKIELLPHEPGVYLMKDDAGRVVYVGKAKDLSRRVRSYFEGSHDERNLIPFLEQAVKDVETVVVDNEKEALLLENELIKRYKPRFNIRLKEGGKFVYLRLPKEAYPRLEVTRDVKKDGARYFGPYPAARALRETLRLVNRSFMLRTCSDHDPRRHKRPCLLCQISRFPEPSVFAIPPEEYRRHVEDAVKFLRGKKPELLATLRRRMEEASSALRFEEAARLRDQVEAVELTLEPQKVAAPDSHNQDFIGLYREGKDLVMYVLYVREGRVLGGRAFPFGRQEFPDPEILASFINLYYGPNQLIPDEVLLPLEIEGMNGLSELLAERKGSSVRLRVPKGGHRKALLELSIRNAREAFPRPGGEAEEAAPVLTLLQEHLQLRRVPHRMECFDVSHFHGAMTVASKVAITEGKLDKDRYRRYKIRTVETGDDYTAMVEVVTRRLKHGLEEDGLPDLIVLDGGRPQLSAGLAAMQALGVTDVDMVALAKKRELDPGGPGAEREQAPERIFLPGRKEPVVLPPSSPDLLILQRLRDEAHRFAITYQKNLTREGALRSRLEHIPGIGEKRKMALLRRFGSVARIAGATEGELAAVEGLGPAAARQIYTFFHIQKS